MNNYVFVNGIVVRKELLKTSDKKTYRTKLYVRNYNPQGYKGYVDVVVITNSELSNKTKISCDIGCKIMVEGMLIAVNIGSKRNPSLANMVLAKEIQNFNPRKIKGSKKLLQELNDTENRNYEAELISQNE